MKKLLPIAGLSLAFVLPVIAAESVRFPPIPPEQFSPQQKQFAELMRQPPRNGNVVNAPFKVYFRSPEFGLHAIGMSDYLRWGTQYRCKADGAHYSAFCAPMGQRIHLARALRAGDQGGTRPENSCGDRNGQAPQPE